MSDINIILAERSGLGTVRLCECRSIHLGVGPVTINLAVDAFTQTATLIRQAMETLAIIIASGELEPNRCLTFNSAMTH